MSTHFDLAQWQVHDTDTDCDLIFRSNSGHVFYCHICPTKFTDSPVTEDTYLKCLKILRSGEEEIDDFYREDAFEWLFNTFEPLIDELLRSLGAEPVVDPTLSHYLVPQQAYNIHLFAVNDKVEPRVLETGNPAWGNPTIKVDTDFLLKLDKWTQSYAPSEVHLCYDRSDDSLIKPPKRATVLKDKQQITCFFKKFGVSFGSSHARRELETMVEISKASLPEAYVCNLLGVVREKNRLLGMLFSWIDGSGVLSRARVAESSVTLRKRWFHQINTSIKQLHDAGIIWGDAKAENILIDKDDNAWIIDFGGSYTLGWVDPDKVETIEGDDQGIRKINSMLWEQKSSPYCT